MDPVSIIVDPPTARLAEDALPDPEPVAFFGDAPPFVDTETASAMQAVPLVFDDDDFIENRWTLALGRPWLDPLGEY
jgi:hypothetical protein